jgi:hypothetical protein
MLLAPLEIVQIVRQFPYAFVILKQVVVYSTLLGPTYESVEFLFV